MAQVPGLPVSGKMYVQSFTASFTAGAGGTTSGGGGRRLLEAGPHRSLLQSNTANNESAIVVAGLNAACASNSGRKLLQAINGIEIVYACAPCSPTCPPVCSLCGDASLLCVVSDCCASCQYALV